jgi:Xaa-Pro aminopeptidase
MDLGFTKSLRKMAWTHERFYKHLNKGEALILFAGSAPRKTADAKYPFFANRNFYYLTGITQTDSILVAVNKCGEVEETLFVHPKNPMAERWNGYRVSHEEASELSGIENVKNLEGFDNPLFPFPDRLFSVFSTLGEKAIS